MFENSRNRLLVRCAVIVAIAAGMSPTPFVAESQQAPRMFRVAFLATGGRTPDGLPPASLREALRGLGYVEGQNVAYEARFGGGKNERLASASCLLQEIHDFRPIGKPRRIKSRPAGNLRLEIRFSSREP